MVLFPISLLVLLIEMRFRRCVSLLISISIIPVGIIRESVYRKAFAKLRRNGYATGYKPARAYTLRDFNDLSSGIRRLAIDTRFQLGRRRAAWKSTASSRRRHRFADRELLASGFCVWYTLSRNYYSLLTFLKELLPVMWRKYAPRLERNSSRCKQIYIGKLTLGLQKMNEPRIYFKFIS